MGCEGNIEVCRFYPFIIHYVEYGGDQDAGIPGECTSWFENHLQVRVAFFEVSDYPDEVIGIVAFPGHQVTAAEVYPFQFGQEGSELFFEVAERGFEVVAVAFAQDVK